MLYSRLLKSVKHISFTENSIVINVPFKLSYSNHTVSTFNNTCF